MGERLAASNALLLPERQFKGIWICAELYESGELSWTEKVLVAEIDSLSSRGVACFAGSEYLAERLGVNQVHMRAMLSNLTNLGYLIRLGFDGRRTLRCAHPDVSSNPMASRQLMAEYKITEHSAEDSCTLKPTAANRSKKKLTAAVSRSLQQLSLKTYTENTSKEIQKETTTTPQGYYHDREPEPAKSVVVVSSGIHEEEASARRQIELLGKEFGLSGKQSADVMEYAKGKGLPYVKEKAEIIRSEPRKNLARAFIAALRDDWQAKKGSPLKKEKRVPEAPEPQGWREYIREQYPKVDISLYPRFSKLAPDIQQEVLDWARNSGVTSPKD